MNDIVQQYRSTALDSTYSSEREQALEKLAEVYGDVDVESKQRVLETYREVAREATHSDERELAREKIRELFERDPATAAPVAVRTFSKVAREARHLDERTRAMDELVGFHRAGIPDELSELIKETLIHVAEEATRDRERERARERLADLTGDPTVAEFDDADLTDLEIESSAATTGGDGTADDTTSYLALSLAEHFAEAASDSPEACLRRGEELRDFVAANDPGDDAHAEVLADLEAFVEQLEVAPTGEELDGERETQVDRIASRVEGLYLRS